MEKKVETKNKNFLSVSSGKINMKKIKLSTAIFSLAVFLFPVLVFGQSEPAIDNIKIINLNSVRVEFPDGEYLPYLRVNNLSIGPVFGDKIKANFEIQNGLSYFTPNVGYKIILLKESKTGGEIASVVNGKGHSYSIIDSVISEDFFSMAPGQKKAIEKEFILPDNLPSGQYFLRVESILSTGVSVSSELSQPFNFAGQGEFLEINKDSCKFIKGNAKIGVTSAVIIPSDQTPFAQCQIKNPTQKTITATGKIIVKNYQKDFINGQPYDGPDISLAPNEEKTVDIKLPQLSDPGTYHGYLQFYNSSGKLVSPEMRLSWTIEGGSAKLVAFIMDKDAYSAGDKAQIALSYAGPSDLYWWYPGMTGFDPTLPKTGGTELTNYEIKVSVFDKQNQLCGETTEKIDKFDFPKGGDIQDIGKKLKTEVPMQKDCRDPQITLTIVKDGKTLSDMSGKIISSGEESKKVIPENIPQTTQKNQSKVILVGIIIFITIMIIVLLLILKKIKSNKIIGVFFLIFSAGFLFCLSVSPAKAAIRGLYRGDSSIASNQTEALGGSNVYFVFQQGSAPDRVTILSTRDNIGCSNGDTRKLRVRSKIEKRDTSLENSWSNYSSYTPWQTYKDGNDECLTNSQFGQVEYDIIADAPMTEGAYAIYTQWETTENNSGSTCGNWTGVVHDPTDRNKFFVMKDANFTPSATPNSGSAPLTTTMSATVGNGVDCSASRPCVWSWDCDNDGTFEKTQTKNNGNSPSNTCTYNSAGTYSPATKLDGQICVQENSTSAGCFFPRFKGPITTPVSVTAPSTNPTLTFFASPSPITPGGSSTLYWSTTKATSCATAGSYKSDWNGVKATSGFQGVGPFANSANYLYYLECKNSAGVSTGIQTATVVVSAAPTFSCTPNGGISSNLADFDNCSGYNTGLTSNKTEQLYDKGSCPASTSDHCNMVCKYGPKTPDADGYDQCPPSASTSIPSWKEVAP